MLREKYRSSELRQKIIDDLRLKEENYQRCNNNNNNNNNNNKIREYQKIINLLYETTNQPSKLGRNKQ